MNSGIRSSGIPGHKSSCLVQQSPERAKLSDDVAAARRRENIKKAEERGGLVDIFVRCFGGGPNGTKSV